MSNAQFEIGQLVAVCSFGCCTFDAIPQTTVAARVYWDCTYIICAECCRQLSGPGPGWYYRVAAQESQIGWFRENELRRIDKDEYRDTTEQEKELAR